MPRANPRSLGVFFEASQYVKPIVREKRTKPAVYTVQ
jgi:hypothetical protein